MSIFSKWFSNKGADSEAKTEPKKPQLSAADYCEQGQKSLDAGKYVEAMEYFQAAIEKEPQNEMAYELLIDTYRAMGREQDAQKTINKLRVAVPNYANVTFFNKSYQPIILQSTSTVSSKVKNNKHTSLKKCTPINPVSEAVIIVIEALISPLKKCQLAIKTKSGAFVFRLFLYTITMLNVMQLLAAITNVTRWDVWEWGQIGWLFGLIGVCVVVFLPSGISIYGLFAIERAPKVNHKKTNILFVLLNVIGVYFLWRFSTSENLYYGPSWSWNHLWLFYRPFVFFIGGEILLLIILIVIYYLAVAISFIGRQIRNFFTT